MTPVTMSAGAMNTADTANSCTYTTVSLAKYTVEGETGNESRNSLSRE